MVSIRILAIRDTPQYQALRLFSFQEAPFAFSESYEDEQAKPLEIYEQLIQPRGNPPEKFVMGAFANEQYFRR